MSNVSVELVELLRTLNGQEVMEALQEAPTENLEEMRDMISYILLQRKGKI